MSEPRQAHPGIVGWAERERPKDRDAPRIVLFDPSAGRTEDVPLLGIRQRIAAPDSFLFGDFQAPTDPELDALARELSLHPLAVDDVRHRHQRPKIDVFPDHYFLVFYRIWSSNSEIAIEELDAFIGPNFLILCHDGKMPLVSEVVDRFCRQSPPHDVSGLLYELLDAVVDEYFPMLDELAERTEVLEAAVFEKFDRERLAELLELKKDLALLRRIIGPERDAVNVLLRRDPPVLDRKRIFYFQDVYDHLIRITDSIDVYRELLTGALDAFLSVENNRLSETVRRLAVVSTIFLPLTFITGFFGMNFEMTTGTGKELFYYSIAAMVAIPLAMLWLIRKSLSR